VVGVFTLEDMGSPIILREGEVKIISVTPVPWGVLRPVLASVIGLIAIVEGAGHFHLVHQIAWWLIGLVVGPVALVAATRIWRWRSHKVHVTNFRVIMEGGVLRHQRTMIELRDVIATRVDQRFLERITRRGYVSLETSGGPMTLGKVRHPAALCRLIDAERTERRHHPVPLDTVFTYDEPAAYDFEVRPEGLDRRDE